MESGSDIAILKGIITQSTDKAQADGSDPGLTNCGLNIVAEQTSELDHAKGMLVMENIITGNPNLKAIFTSNNKLELGAIKAFKNADMLVLSMFPANGKFDFCFHADKSSVLAFHEIALSGTFRRPTPPASPGSRWPEANYAAIGPKIPAKDRQQYRPGI